MLMLWSLDADPPSFGAFRLNIHLERLLSPATGPLGKRQSTISAKVGDMHFKRVRSVWVTDHTFNQKPRIDLRSIHHEAGRSYRGRSNFVGATRS